MGRVDNVYGDRNLFCSCVPMSEFAEAAEAEAPHAPDRCPPSARSARTRSRVPSGWPCGRQRFAHLLEGTIHGSLGFRPLQDRHRPVQLAHGGPDARGAHVRPRGSQHEGLLERTARVKADLYGSLGATGKGHGSDKAVLLGLHGHEPDTVDIERVPLELEAMRANKQVLLGGMHIIAFDEATDLVMHRRETLPFHANGMRFTAFDAARQRAREPRLLLGGRRLRRQRRGGGRRLEAEDDRARHHGAALPVPQRRRPAAG